MHRGDSEKILGMTSVTFYVACIFKKWGMEEEQDGDQVFNLICVLICIACGASAAGLTMGLLSLDSLKLKIKLVTGDAQEKADVQKLLPVLEDHHFLLCTLLIFNAVANEAMPIFLDALVPSWAAVLVSVTLVLVFGEVVPTATFTGPQQLRIVSTFVPVVHILQTLFYPVAKPMAIALDYFLGHDEGDEGYTRDELSAMVRILRSKDVNVGSTDSHIKSPRSSGNSDQNKASLALSVEGKGDQEPGDSSDSDSSEEEPLTANEVDVITGVLSLSKMTMLDLLTPLDRVNMVSQSQIFDAISINAVLKAGHSRLPVFKDTNRKDIIGIFRTKALVGIDPDDRVKLSTFPLRRPLVVGAGQTPLNALNLFQQGQSHIALVSHDPVALLHCMLEKKAPSTSCEPIGIVTLEDVIEAMIQSQIYDEEDKEESAKVTGVRNEDLFALAMTAATTSGTAKQGGWSTVPKLSKSVSTGSTQSSLRATEGTGLLSPSPDAEVDGVELGESLGSGDRERTYQSISMKSEGEDCSAQHYRKSGYNGASSSASASFYRKFDCMYDSAGVPLIPRQDGALKTQLVVASLEGARLGPGTAAQNHLTQTRGADNRIRPSIVNKYVKRSKYIIGGEKERKPRKGKRDRSASESSKSSRVNVAPNRHSITS